MIQSQLPISAIAPQNTVSINLNAENVHDVIDFLVQQQIPFELKYYLQPEDISKPTSNQTPLKPKARKAADAMAGVYQKYIVKGAALAATPIAQIAKDLGMSVPKFNALFKAQHGESFYKVFLTHKMKHAAKLLEEGHKCNQVSELVGYGENSSIKFNKMFQKHFSVTPKKYQMAYK